MVNIKSVSAFFVIIVAVLVSLLNRWEMGGESWGYWYFAKVFSENGTFIIFDRSPLYALYLSGFRWLGYPDMVTVEYIVTTTIGVVALVLLLEKYMGLGMATFASVLWIPFLQVEEPQVQKLALACSCLAIVARRYSGREWLMASYALFGMAWMFRSTYIVFIGLFIIWDIFKNKMKVGIPKIGTDWPVILVVVLGVWFMSAQSNDVWNNAWGVSTDWFPNDGKSLADASFIQHFNWEYIRVEYGSFEGRDFYFTNQELFGGASGMSGAVFVNPQFVAEQLVRNVVSLIHFVVYITAIPSIYPISGVWSLAVFVVIVYGVVKAVWMVGKGDMTMFVLGSGLVIGTTVLSLPKERYMAAFIPLMILSSFWWGRWLVRHRVGTLVVPSLLILSSSGSILWLVIGDNIVRGDLYIMENKGDSMKANYYELKEVTKNCKGVMTLEHLYFRAFIGVKSYDVYEIPPFFDSKYDGLRPDRVDCVAVSSELANGVGMATNYQMRYQEYVKPYVKKLENMGAVTSEIRGYGNITVLKANV